jgi:hypothetical protein
MPAGRSAILALPHFFIVGAAKSGTTSLHITLGRHPDVVMSAVKEPHFFSRPPVWEDHRAFFHRVTRDADYRALFPGPIGARMVGESSTSYLWEPTACRRIAECLPGAKIVVCLRDPVDRAFSHYLDNVRDGFEQRPFGQALSDEHLHGADWLTAYVDIGRYADQVQRYLEAFPAAVLVIYFEELIASPGAELRRLIEFLGLEPHPLLEDLASANRHSAPRNRVSGRILESRWVRRGAHVAVPQRLRAPAYKRLTRSVPRPEMAADTRAWLVEQYAGEAGRLEQLTARAAPWPWVPGRKLAVVE